MLRESTDDDPPESQEHAATAPQTKQLPDQRRRCMSDKFMMFTYKIKICRRQDPHNWRLCPYAHPGEAGKRRPPHAYQAVMCDFSRTRKECSHGDTCLLARNALEYWLHPAKYKTILCGHGEACNRNICFFAHNQLELRTPATTSGAVLSDPDIGAAADAFSYFSIGGHPAAGSSSRQAAAAAAGPQVVYVTDSTAAPAVGFASTDPAAASSLVQPVQVLGPQLGPGIMQQQLLVPMQVATAPSEQQQQQQQQQVRLVPAAAGSSLHVHPYHPAGVQAGSMGMVVTGQPGTMQMLPSYHTRQQVQPGQQVMRIYEHAQQQFQVGQQQRGQPGQTSRQQLQQVVVVCQAMPAGAGSMPADINPGSPVIRPAAAAAAAGVSPQAATLQQQQQPVPAQPVSWTEQAQFPGMVPPEGAMTSYYAVPLVPSVPAGAMIVGASVLQPGQYMQRAGYVNLPPPPQQYEPQQQLQQPFYYHQQQQQQPNFVVLSSSTVGTGPGSSTGGSYRSSNPGQLMVGMSSAVHVAAPAQYPQ